jgi:hypothetical protein
MNYYKDFVDMRKDYIERGKVNKRLAKREIFHYTPLLEAALKISIIGKYYTSEGDTFQKVICEMTKM